MLRITSSLPDNLEQLAEQVIGCCVAVHRELGPGFIESIYAKAIISELRAQALPFEVEKAIPVRYRGEIICHQRLDLIVGGQLVVELKAVDRLDSIHVAQVLSYLRGTDLRLGLLVNFNVSILKFGIRRVIL